MLTLFNLCLILFGSILVIIGISAHNHLNAYIELIGNDNIKRAALTLVVSGIICCLTALVSYFAAKKHSVCLLYLTSSILFFVFIAVTVAATGAVVFHSKIDIVFKKGMNQTIAGAAWESNDPDLDIDQQVFYPNNYMQTIGYLQESLKCCGIDNYHDWQNLNIRYKDSDHARVPVSCCKTDYCGKIDNGQVILDTNSTAQPETSKIYTNGCYEKITDFVSTNTIAVLICSYGLAIFQLVGIIFSCCLCKAIQGAENYRRLNH